ncbi:MAG: transglutaminase domain-containing protein [Candidatus Lokiarchaeota archaeon]|nr:transglutaminase domain-containing protein [Candidatus Lokiarchaeota archaeon]
MDKKEEIPEEQESWYKGPIKWILAIFLIFILILMIVPRYAVKLDPEPKKIPKIDELKDFFSGIKTENRTTSLTEAFKFVNPSDPVIKQTSTIIASQSCEQSRVCQAKALYYFVRDNIEYVGDPINSEYIESPIEVMQTKGADCESGSLLLASLEEAIGVDSQLVIIPGHAYLRILLPEAAKIYKIDNEWVYLDWTCKSCSFGEIPWKNIQKQATYLEVP